MSIDEEMRKHFPLVLHYSAIIPCKHIAMARLPRATFALLLSLLPAPAAIIGIVVLHQVPTGIEIAGILLVAGGVALHQEAGPSPKDSKSHGNRRGRGMVH